MVDTLAMLAMDRRTSIQRTLLGDPDETRLWETATRSMGTDMLPWVTTMEDMAQEDTMADCQPGGRRVTGRRKSGPGVS
ncbi:hypothetical protein PR003_g16082 [Phytophthora rubi]|uniref:Uncharacterized protein n=1 Tax=Phytophthora rubi TaxID=129364 RepID=A0A6A4ES15_9STRA|nr:hypothetical protein PR002_g15831 [Phytophthora rubi]KAE9013640.1 hypothetical protein PR001_g15361 [Phytophthora rubi]KAE9327138.1 hypothetical protein PR003_g16082 [Phytophthora rubi]